MEGGDREEMSKSILNTQKYICYRCGKYGQTEKHHVMSGTANRRLSEEDGLYVYLCHTCHNEPPNGVHFNKKTMDWLRNKGQRAYECKMIQEGMSPSEAREMFMKRYGKNYL